MARTVIWRVAGSDSLWTREVGDPAFLLSPTAAGDYEVDPGDGLIRTVTIPAQAVEVTTVPVQLADVGQTKVFALNSISPTPSGTATWSEPTPLPLEMADLSGSTLSFFMPDAAPGTYAVLREDDGADRRFEFDLAVVQPFIEFDTDDRVQIDIGRDDAVDYTVNVSYDSDGSETWTLPAGAPVSQTQGVFVRAPVIEILSGEGTEANAGKVMPGGVVRVRPLDPIRGLYLAGGTPEAIASAWYDGSGVIPSATNPAGFTIPNPNTLTGNIYCVQGDSRSTLTSNTIEFGASAPPSALYTHGATLDFVSYGSSGTVFEIASAPVARQLLMQVHCASNRYVDSFSFDGDAYTVPQWEIRTSSGQGFQQWVIPVPAGVSGPVTFTRAAAALNVARFSYGLVADGATIGTPVRVTSGSNNATLTSTATVAEGGALLAAMTLFASISLDRLLNFAGATFSSKLQSASGGGQFGYRTGIPAGDVTVTSTNTGESGGNSKSLILTNITPGV